MTGVDVVAVVDYRSADAPLQLTESLRDTGFCVLVNHPIPASLIVGVQQEWLTWFDGSSKFDYLPGAGQQDGYHPLTGQEQAVGHDVPDLKEFFHWYPWGRQPSGLSGRVADLYRLGTDLGSEVLGWVEAHTPPHVAARFSMPLARMLEGSHRTLLRILRYPPLTGDEPDGAVRAAAHEDINLLTVLPAADAPGLRVQDQAGLWHDIPADPGSVVINSGDMLKLASGGYYPSATHEVVNPTGAEANRSRTSTPLFLEPADAVVLVPGITAFDFLRERLLRIRGVDIAQSL
jgi:isopenicillin N synthase-like dioxygenase